MITYKGEVDDNLFISQIKSLIKNSFDDVRYENISIVLFPAP
jgi:type III secretion protein J